MSAATAAPLSVDDYERVFRVVHGVLLNERGSPSEACLYFGAFGAAILATHHNLAALPVVGAAAYRLGTLASDVLAFAQPTPSSGHASSENAFHCWVQVNGWALDFSAPLFDERLARAGMPRAYGRKMLQKPLKGMVEGLGAMHVAGAYWYESNPDLGAQLLGRLHAKPANIDLLEICLDWYRPLPNQLREFITIGDQHGVASRVPLSPLLLEGAW